MSDASRAGFHIQPRKGWTNDPNGMLFRDGRWHVFFQHNPAAALHTDIDWGHVSSDDLVTGESTRSPSGRRRVARTRAAVGAG